MPDSSGPLTSAGNEPATKLPVRDRLVLYTTVALTGSAVMVLELLGTRIIGPYSA